MTHNLSLLGRGLYSLTEAARLTRVPIRRINRWTRGYWFAWKGQKQWSGPIVGDGEQRIGDAPFLDFADLIEIRGLSALRDRNIGWPTIRLASIHGKEVLQTTHPFSSNRFITLGRSILAEVVDEAGDRRLIDLVDKQYVFHQLVMEELRKNIDYRHEDRPQMWAPLGEGREVVIDPARAFGAPIVRHGSVRTRVLAGAFQAMESHDEVAKWYRVSRVSVVDAVEFEEGIRLAA